MIKDLIDIKIGNYSVYSNGWYPNNFVKCYKGIRVNVRIVHPFDDDKFEDIDSRFIKFSIRTKSADTYIWKSPSERMDRLVFDDRTLAITCDREKSPKNTSLDSITFKEDEYEELKENIPNFLRLNGCKFEVKDTEHSFELVF